MKALVICLFIQFSFFTFADDQTGSFDNLDHSYGEVADSGSFVQESNRSIASVETSFTAEDLAQMSQVSFED
jgi:hypothetical protein